MAASPTLGYLLLLKTLLLFSPMECAFTLVLSGNLSAQTLLPGWRGLFILWPQHLDLLLWPEEQERVFF